MGWERQKPFTTEQPSPPSSGGWVISGVLAVLAGVLLFVLHASGSLTVLKLLNIWLFALIPVVLWILTFSTRGYLYGRELERFQFFQREAEHAQQQWTAWAERYIAVSANCVMLPDSVSAALLKQSLRGLPQQQGLVRRIDYLKGNKAVMNALLGGIESSLQNLPGEAALQVTVLTDEPESGRQKLYTLFDECWLAHAPVQLCPSSLNITDQLSLQYLDERLGQPESTIQLIIVMQMHGDARYSDGLAALLFTSDDVAQKYTLPHAVRVLRPMLFDVSHLSEELSLLLTTQTQACQTLSVLADHQKWTQSSAALITIGNALGTRWEAENILTIETYCGIQGPFSPWLTLALGADFVHIGQQSWLALSTTGAENFVYTIASGSGDERFK